MNEEREEFEPAGGDRSALRARHSQVEVRFNDVLDEFARLPLDARLAGSVVDTHLLTQLQRLPLFELDPTTLVEVVAAAERVISHVQGLQLQATAALAEQLEMTPPDLADHTRGPADVAGDELSLRLRRPRGQAQTMVRRSRALTTVLTGTGDALTAGLIDLPRAAAIVDGLDGVAWQVAELVEEQVLPRAPERTARQVRDDVAAALVDVDPAEAERRASRRRQDRHVSRPRAHSDGVASLRIEGPAADVLTLDLALDAAARGAKARGDNRTLDQLRFDCLATVGGHALATGRLGPAEVGLPLATENGRRPEIQVQVSLADLIPPDPGGDTEASDGPARSAASAPILAGYGPITPTAARALAAGGTWRRVVTDPVTGTVLNVGRTRYRPTTAIAEHVRTRDRTCVRPGCEHRASSCQLDHTDEWRDPERYRRGGSTSVTNLAPLCTRDHLIKTHGDFGVTQVEPGVFEWRTPSGHRYRRERDGSTRLLSHCTPMRPIVMVGPADRGRYEDAGGGRGDAIVMHEGWSSASGDQELEPPF